MGHSSPRKSTTSKTSSTTNDTVTTCRLSPPSSRSSRHPPSSYHSSHAASSHHSQAPSVSPSHGISQTSHRSSLHSHTSSRTARRESPPSKGPSRHSSSRTKSHSPPHRDSQIAQVDSPVYPDHPQTVISRGHIPNVDQNGSYNIYATHRNNGSTFTRGPSVATSQLPAAGASGSQVVQHPMGLPHGSSNDSGSVVPRSSKGVAPASGGFLSTHARGVVYQESCNDCGTHSYQNNGHWEVKRWPS